MRMESRESKIALHPKKDLNKKPLNPIYRDPEVARLMNQIGPQLAHLIYDLHHHHRHVIVLL